MDFKCSQYERDIILWGMRWYVAYPISYRQLEESSHVIVDGQPYDSAPMARKTQTTIKK